MKKAYFYDTMYGRIGLAQNEQGLTNVFFRRTVAPKVYELEETPLLDEAARQMQEYFAGRRREFQLPLVPEGTPFELSVWKALCTIPYGEIRTYRQIAQQIGRPTACRAVGHANGLNPVSIFIPCHRVIGTSGKLTGYAGGLDMKEKLLRMEGSFPLGRGEKQK